MPTITVAIPVYNGAKTIHATLESIIQQSFEDIEIVIIDDGSIDETVEIVRQVKDSRIRLISYPNQGLAASRNRGIQQSQCELISFIDADDLWTPDKLSEQLSILQANPRAAIAYSWTDCIDQVDRFFRRGSYLSVEGHVYDKLLMGNFLDSGSNALFRKSVFAAVGQFDESLKAAEDWDMFLRIAVDHTFVVVPKVQVLYRLSPQSMSAHLERQESESRRVLTQAFARKPGLSWQTKRKSLAQMYRYLTFKALENCSTRQQALITAKYLGQAIYQDPVQLKPIRLFLSQLQRIIETLTRP
ncbi:glycosyltransferase [Leptothoe spongobia]|uniref:Glycosyltransferase n=1 Tax=Leptothoe spongobia TAU-MAC 1115 TaxID=1967444 RepID=A0A947DJ19_9CYAN|nr:glycosyltransferase [Leptothoe spongobia]MBT9317524.1 glycosyltransferase [Leptothoe spongobia TAU-MAC 1115]